MPGDLIKIGRVRFKIKELVSKAYLKLQQKHSMRHELINSEYHHVIDLEDVGVEAVMSKYKSSQNNKEQTKDETKEVANFKAKASLHDTKRALDFKKGTQGAEREVTDPDIGINQPEDNGFDHERVEMLNELHNNAKKEVTSDGQKSEAPIPMCRICL